MLLIIHLDRLVFLEKMLEALRQCEPEMPTLLGGGDGSTNAAITMEFFTQSSTLGVQQGTMTVGGSLVEDGISSTSSPSSSSSSSASSSPTLAASMVVHTLAELYDRELVSTIGWAKQIPGSYTNSFIHAYKYVYLHSL